MLIVAPEVGALKDICLEGWLDFSAMLSCKFRLHLYKNGAVLISSEGFFASMYTVLAREHYSEGVQRGAEGLL